MQTRNTRYQPRRVIRVQTWSDRREFDKLVRDVRGIDETEIQAELFYPSRAAARHSKRTGVQFSAPPPYEVFMWIVTTANGLIKLAEVVRRYLRKRSGYRYEGSLVKAKERSAVIKFNGKEMTIKGNWSRNDLQLLLDFSKPVAQDQMRLFDKKRRREMATEMNDLRESIGTYRKLVSIGNASKQIGPELKMKLRQYKRTLQRLESRLQLLEEMKKRDKVQRI